MLPEREGEGKAMVWAAPQRESLCPGSFVLSFSLSLAGGILGEVSGEGSVEYSSVFRVLVSTDGSVPGQGSLSLKLVWAQLVWFCCFSGSGAETQVRPGNYLQGWELLHLAVNCSATVFSCLSFSVPLAKKFS